MPLLNGMDAAKEIRQHDSNVRIIFLTSSPEYAVESYDVKASGYLLKPVDYEKLCRAISDCALSLDYEPEKIILRTALGFQSIYIHNIEFLEAQNKKVVFTLSDGSTFNALDTLSNLGQQLTPEKGFFRCHRSYIVNLSGVDFFSMTEIRTKTGRLVPIARGLGKAFKDAYFALMFRD